MKKTNTLSLSFLIFLSFFIFLSCEWDNNEDHFVEIKKPSDIQIGIDLAGATHPDQIIYVYNNSWVGYTLSTQGKEMTNCEFYLDGVKLTNNSYEGNVYLSADKVDSQIHQLKLIIALKGGSGSVADFSNLEHYLGEFTFNIKFVDRDESSQSLNVRQSLEEGKYLKIEWDKPVNLPVKKYLVYELSSYKEIVRETIDNPKQTYFVDKDYAYGLRQYRIEAIIDGGADVSVKSNYTVQYTTLTEDDFNLEFLKPDEVKVTWTNPNPYPANYVLETSYGTVTVDNGALETIIKHTGLFPIHLLSLSAYVIPSTARIEDYLKYNYAYVGIKTPNMDGGAIDYAFITPNRLYAIDFSNIKIYDTDHQMKLLRTIPTTIIKTTGAIIKSSPEGLIGIEDGLGKLRVYKGTELDTKLLEIADVSRFQFGAGKLLVTYKENYLTPIRTDIYDTQTLQKTVVNGLDNYAGYALYLSPDSKYLFAKDYKTGELLELQGNTLASIQKINKEIGEVRFNETDGSDMILIPSNSFEGFEIRKLPSLELKKEVKGTFCNIDPLSGNILYCIDYPQSPLSFGVINKDKTKTASFQVGNLGNPYALLINHMFIYSNYLCPLTQLNL